MVLTNPRPLAELNDLLLIKTVVPRVARADEFSRLGSSQIIAAEMADPLRAFDVTLDWYDIAAGNQLRARFNSLQGSIETFLLTVPLQEYPAADPGGVLIAGSTVVIEAIGGDNRSVSFSGLPANYQLTLGDFWHVDFAADPVRRGFFEMSESVVADSEGVTAAAVVFPFIPPGLEPGAEVTFVRPACKVFIMPETLQAGRNVHPHIDGMSFTAMQKL